MSITEKDETMIVGVDIAKQRRLHEGQDRLLGRHDTMGRPYGGRSTIKKRSVVIDGRKSSVSLENEFWDGVREVAHSSGLSIQTFVAGVIARYEGHNLSSALRLAVLDHYRQEGDAIEERHAVAEPNFGLASDPASLKDLAAALRDDAVGASDETMRARLLALAEEAETQAEAAEASALWSTPIPR